MSFPDGFGELENMTFEEVFEKHPKWVECCDSCWTENNTGLFKRFYDFVKEQLSEASVREEHEKRCRAYVKTLGKSECPRYLVKYA